MSSSDYVAGASFLANLYGRFNPSVRHLQRDEYANEKARQQAALDSIQREQAFRATEDPREQAQLRQEMAGRGLGKSSINTQNMARLQAIQANRNTELSTNQALAGRGLALINRRRLTSRRMQPMEVWNMAMQAANQAGGEAGGKGGGAGLEALAAVAG